MKKVFLNIILCIKYPFLYSKYFTNRFGLPKITWYDCIPDGWRIAFGMQLIKDLKASLKHGEKIQIVDIKEKWGYLHIYYIGGNKETDKVIDKYEELSFHTCIYCGKPAKYFKMSWITPCCENCIKGYTGKTKKIEEIENEAFDNS